MKYLILYLFLFSSMARGDYTLLNKLYEEDQKDRMIIGQQIKKYGNESKEVHELLEAIAKSDAGRKNDFIQIIEKYGWPKRSKQGEAISNKAFILLQHTDLITQIKYSKIFDEMIEKNEVNPIHYATLKDRIKIKLGEKQRYGTQVMMTPEGKFALHPIENNNKNYISRIRKEHCLIPIKAFLSSLNIEDKNPLDEKIKIESKFNQIFNMHAPFDKTKIVQNNTILNSQHIKFIEDTYDAHGWPTFDSFNITAVSQAIMLLYLTDSNTINKYIHQINKLAETNQVPLNLYATLKDLYLIKRGETQIFNTISSAPKSKNKSVIQLRRQYCLPPETDSLIKAS